MAWLISCRIEAVYRTANRISRNAPMDVLVVTNLRPAEWFIEQRKKLLALMEQDIDPSKQPLRVDDVLVIYSAFEVDSDEAQTLRDIL